MAPLFWKTFGGITAAYYFRNLFFALIPVLAYFALRDNVQEPPLLWTYAFVTVNTLLYPYARFLYESIVDFVLGRSVFYMNAGVLLFFKLLTMYLCWFGAMLIAPISLLYIYIIHSRRG
ncbi:hypothetical protein [Ramlibacter sp. WS9]|uniref:hypothetical protein n=1 Tax=Ramlibacter sp. WS9 TaxID=1882741 RepID=UPI0011414478|nr:hypothetical protein [Ramlibacter sp. WS9]ROZ74950.1 hypothetical protein EEB15_16335 [Ramlibacter sp. WS9]